MGYDMKTFTVAIVSMAVKGLLRIRDDDGKYTLEKTDKIVGLYNDEFEAKGKIFLSKNSFKVDSKSHWTMNRALSRHEYSLIKDYEGKYFTRNTSIFWAAQLITLFTLVLMCMYASEHGKMSEYIFSLFIAGGWTAMVIILLPALIRLWRGERSARLYTRLFLGLVLPVVFMMLMTGTNLWNLFSMSTLRLLFMNSVLPLMLVMLAINAAFFYWMKAPTKAGQEMLDKIKSFKFYLKMANEGRIEFDEELRLTPEDYDSYLPYAMALDFESEWGEFVHGIFSEISDPDAGISQPDWYDGDDFHDQDFSRFTRRMGTSLSSSFASASVDPTTSSSSSGGGSSGFSGGSSGGGGGGGGGGGW